jgi:hypothetical protein
MKSKPDNRLAGLWREKEESGTVSYYHVGRADEKLPEGAMQVVGLEHQEGRVRGPLLWLIFPTTLGDKTYLNLTAGSEYELEQLQKHGWSTVEGYCLFRYKVEGKKLLLWGMDDDAKERAIKSGKLKGVIKKGTWNTSETFRFTDTTENFARFVAEAGESLFSKEPMTLEKIDEK